MSDKSFGDHMSRGIVKNPLLSTAVTGLSIEDLTHNAVLLPVSRTQEPIGRQEPETPAQFTPTPSGDTFTPIETAPKDDFDVNEYFARLQGTTYVSAPLNSHIESNIEKEDNLEEINLNENEDIQLNQSITADIAQNFSQLPTVLPQVASAVFSSFSNMLMKRETPERVQQSASETQGVETVPLVGVSEKAPLREPPTSGHGNFRLTTKKKYAQIPGLSSGESGQMPTYTPPTFNQPIFTPQPELKDNFINTSNIPTDVGQTNVDFNAFSNVQNIPLEHDNKSNVFETKQDTNFAASQFQDSNQQGIIPPPPMFSNLSKRDSVPSVGKTILPPSVARRIGSNKPTITNQAPAFAAVGNIFVPAPIAAETLPQNASQPSFMGSNPTSFPSSYTSQEASPVIPMSTPIQSTVSSTTIPPVASLATTTLASAILQVDSSINVPENSASGIPTFTTENFPPPPKNAFASPPAMTSQATVPLIRGKLPPPPIIPIVHPPATTSQATVPSIPGNLPPPPKNAFDTPAIVSQSTGSLVTENLPPPPRNAFASPPTMAPNAPEFSMTSSAQSASVLSSPQFNPPGSKPQSVIPPPITGPNNPTTTYPLFPNTAGASSPMSIISVQPQMSTSNLQNQSTSGLSAQSATSAAAPQIFNPNEHLSLLSKDITNYQLQQTLPPAEPHKIPEPPKASGNTNFRMTKKRPQYYSGPIEGVGAISNNVKPTLMPVATTAFQGAVFTPESNAGQTELFTPENVTENASSHGAILPPGNNEHQQQYYNFAPVDVNQSSSNINYPASVSEASTYNYNTAFDLSQQAPDAYEAPKQESAFGIIGSLKSKLSSIDINKLQNSVTTFFDPGYNMVKTDTAQNTQSNYGQNQGLEIFIANPETQVQPFNYDVHQHNFTYGQGSIPNASDYYNQQVHNVYSTSSYYSQPTYGTQSYSRTNLPIQQGYSQPPNNTTSVINTETSQGVNLWASYDPTSTGHNKDYVADKSNITHDPTPAVETESTKRANIWDPYDQSSTNYDKDCVSNSTPKQPSALDINAVQVANASTYDPTGYGYKDNIADNNNITHEQTSSVDIDTTQRAYAQSTYDRTTTTISSGSNKDNVTDNNSVTHEQLSSVDTDIPKRDNMLDTYDSAFSTSYDKDYIAQFYNITQEPPSVVEFKSAQELNIGDSYDPAISRYDKETVVEHETGNDGAGAFFQGQPEISISKMVKMSSGENVAEAIKNLQIKDNGKTNLEQIGLEEKQNMSFNKLSQPIFPGVIDIDENDELKKSGASNYVDMFKNSDNPELPSAFDAPLQNPFSNPEEISDGVSEGCVSWNSNEEEVDDQSSAERLMSLANEDFEDDNLCADEGEQDDNLDICVTCREVNQPVQMQPVLAEDLTHQMIKNITAPIQLSNPVEVPLTETDINRDVPDEFDTINQCAEISLIADETIETLQIQSASDLLNETESTNIDTSYGWRIEAPLPPGEDLLDHDYTFKTNSSAIGSFANNNLFFDNVSNYGDIKTELNVPQKEAPILLQSQMSIPSAPPAEDSDDAKSDETGVLDVQSIEQDASKDFPVFEEYVIEPSEMDDDKIEFKSQGDEVKDTFTNRVARFKKLEGNDDAIEKNDFADLSIPNTMMPSYFDTGNYAVETHVKNSLKSPTIARIPPGFEDHYELVPKGHNQRGTVKVPETSTQTTITTTISDVHTKTENLTSTVLSNITPLTNEPTNIQEPKLETRLPDFTGVFQANIKLADTSFTGAEISIESTKEHTSVNPQANIEDKVQENKPIPLPDPINFFASSTQETETTEGVNRLASYFAAPPKTNTTKSFFELSQGQDHYRQNDEIKGSKPFFELSQSQDHYKENIANIPHDRYIANLNLMSDLTSPQNIEPNKEQIVRTVNYFTVEYDNDILNFNKGEPSLNIIKQNINKQTANQPDIVKDEIELEKEETILNDEILTEIIKKCRYCKDLKAGPILTINEVDLDLVQVRFRQAMDGASSPKKEQVNVEPRRDKERSVNVRMEDVASDGDNSEGVAMMTENRSSNEYEAVKHHWFYRVDCEDKSTWRGFSVMDSRAIENAFQSPNLNESTLVPTDGGRYDVNVIGRLRIAVYWSDKPTNVRRCSWFYKGTTDARYVPYTEAVAEKLEVEYRHGITTGEWHRRLVLPNNELVVMHGPAVMVHFLQAGATDAFSAPNQSAMRPRVVRRGIDESEIEDSEPSSIDHLLLLCHGVGSACDMRFRAVEEVVDDFRATSLQLLQSHYRNSYDNGIVGRVEVLPISWHASLHAGPRGVDRRLARVTLASIPRLRNFTNDTVLDVLFYTSPHYCQMILDTVCGELNRIYTLFMSRNPDFKGRVSLGGHSLGSVILYDLLCNQPIPRNPVKPRSEKTYISGTAANNPTMQYPTLCFEPLALYALGSPIAIFECIRGVDMLGSDFYLPTCRNFFNIFHPYDPIAYRIEPLVNPQLQDVKPSLIPHHKGRKRMHLELKDTMARVGADLKQKLVESIKSTWSSMWSSAAPPDHQLEKVVEEEIEKEQLEEESSKDEPVQADVTPGEMLGRLNNGRRVDYVLQEAPFEMINEYIFAMSSHVCYWESEDVMLLILREIYDSMGVQPDVTVPQQSLTVQRTTIVTSGERIVTSDASTSRLP
ncbi:uncharacterized protein LOC133532394 isoform X2 [Cydia pomonella]|uniref:uncharacterized protein LOC133532394 isoform X2 n=2 Tax=Cydia pomonella TaxID=82600 RepID=UPI002ADDA4F1|nr:uncharacterized protein LOC133532394 isoform X2 [Cydia pomonella]